MSPSSLSKVFANRGDNNWLFRERTAEVFERNSYWSRHTPIRPAAPPPPPTESPDNPQDQPNDTQVSSEAPYIPYDSHFVVDFCDNVDDLLMTYFDHFYIEGVPEPHRAFTSSISLKFTAQHLGIHPSYLSSEYSFVLIRLPRRKRRAALAGERFHHVPHSLCHSSLSFTSPSFPLY